MCRQPSQNATCFPPDLQAQQHPVNGQQPVVHDDQGGPPGWNPVQTENFILEISFKKVEHPGGFEKLVQIHKAYLKLITGSIGSHGQTRSQFVLG